MSKWLGGLSASGASATWTSGTLVCALRYLAPQPSSSENDPRKANTLLASSSVAFWLPWQLVLSSLNWMRTLWPHSPPWLLRKAANAWAPCGAPSNNPLTGPLVLDTLPRTMLLEVIPTSVAPLQPDAAPCVPPWLPCVPCVPLVPWVPPPGPTGTPGTPLGPLGPAVPVDWGPVPLPDDPALSAAVDACLRSSGLSRAPHAAAVSTASSTRAVTRTRRIAGPPLGVGTAAPGRRLVPGTVEGPSLQHKGRT